MGVFGVLGLGFWNLGLRSLRFLRSRVLELLGVLGLLRSRALELLGVLGPRAFKVYRVLEFRSLRLRVQGLGGSLGFRGFRGLGSLGLRG